MPTIPFPENPVLGKLHVPEPGGLTFIYLDGEWKEVGKFKLLDAPAAVPLITLEDSDNWNAIYVLREDGFVDEIPKSIIVDTIGENDELGFLRGSDSTTWHHPRLLQYLAMHYNAAVSKRTLEIVMGRRYLSSDSSFGQNVSFNETGKLIPLDHLSAPMVSSNDAGKVFVWSFTKNDPETLRIVAEYTPEQIHKEMDKGVE